jgi:hypothetical protein
MSMAEVDPKRKSNCQSALPESSRSTLDMRGLAQTVKLAGNSPRARWKCQPNRGKLRVHLDGRVRRRRTQA